MIVGVFCPTFNVYGGAEFVAFCICNVLAKEGYDVVTFVDQTINRREVSEFFGKQLHPSVSVVVKSSPFYPRGLPDFYQSMVSSFGLKRKTDLWIDVHSNCVFPWTDVSYIHFPFLNSYSFRSKFPYIRSKHLLQIGTLPYVLFEKNITSFDGKLVIANSHYTSDEIRKFSGKCVSVVYPPVFTFNSKESESISERNRRDTVVTISRFGRGKGLENVPYIASLTKSDVKFVVIGRLHDVSVFNSIQRSVQELKLKDKVKLFCDIPKERIRKILKNSKIYLHTMEGEHFGISIVEAMAAGCFPIVHDSGGAREFVPSIYRYRSVRDAANKIDENVSKWSLTRAKEMIMISRRFDERNFSREFMSVFNKYVDERQSSHI